MWNFCYPWLATPRPIHFTIRCKILIFIFQLNTQCLTGSFSEFCLIRQQQWCINWGLFEVLHNHKWLCGVILIKDSLELNRRSWFQPYFCQINLCQFCLIRQQNFGKSTKLFSFSMLCTDACTLCLIEQKLLFLRSKLM